jgi:hypothetical protein
MEEKMIGLFRLLSKSAAKLLPIGVLNQELLTLTSDI